MPTERGEKELLNLSYVITVGMAFRFSTKLITPSGKHLAPSGNFQLLKTINRMVNYQFKI